MSQYQARGLSQPFLTCLCTGLARSAERRRRSCEEIGGSHFCPRVSGVVNALPRRLISNEIDAVETAAHWTAQEVRSDVRALRRRLLVPGPRSQVAGERENRCCIGGCAVLTMCIDCDRRELTCSSRDEGDLALGRAPFPRRQPSSCVSWSPGSTLDQLLRRWSTPAGNLRLSHLA